MKITATMRYHLNSIENGNWGPRTEDGRVITTSYTMGRWDPLLKRGLVEYVRRTEWREHEIWCWRLTDEGRRILYQNEPPDGVGPD